MHTIYSLWCGERGIQTPGTDKPFTGFRVRPNRSLWHLSWLLELPTKVRKKIEKGSLQIPVAPSIKHNRAVKEMIGLHSTQRNEDLPTSEALPILNIVERIGFPLWVVVLYLFTSRFGFVTSPATSSLWTPVAKASYRVVNRRLTATMPQHKYTCLRFS